MIDTTEKQPLAERKFKRIFSSFLKISIKEHKQYFTKYFNLIRAV